MKFNMLGDANHAGQVRLSDIYTSAGGSAKDGVAASQRALYEAYNSLNSSISNLNSNISYIGMIIHSTVLDTMEKVISQYGGITWIQHSGYVLRGASSGVVADDNTKTGGDDNAIVPYHNHTFTGTSKSYTSGKMSANASHSHNVSTLKGSIACPDGTYHATWSRVSGYNYATTSTNTDHTHSTTIKPEGTVGYAGNSNSWSNGTNKNIPNYKSVYIWERTE